MYIVLLEAGGLSQMARIHASWHRRFLHDLDDVLARHRFRRVREEGDLLYFCQNDQVLDTDSLLVVDAMRGILGFLRSHGDTLLDYLVLMGFDRHGDSIGGSRALEDHLPGVRETNSLYMTAPVYEALGEMVETVLVGRLHRLVTLHADRRSSPDSFRESLARTDSVEEIRQLLRVKGGKSALWVWGPDRSITTATVQTALGREGGAPVTIQCRREMSRADFQRALIRELPDQPAFTSTDEEAEYDQALTELRRCLRNPGALYLSAGWMEEDLSLVAEHVVRRFLQSESQRLLFVSDYDLPGLPLSDILGAVPDTITVSPLVVSGTAPPDDDRWDVVHVAADFPGALHFWCGLGGDLRDERTVDESFVGESSRDEVAATTEVAGEVLCRVLSAKHRRVLFLLARGPDIQDPVLFDRLFLSLDITLVERSRILSDLFRLGLLANLDPLRVQPAAEELLDSLLTAEDRSELQDVLAREVLTQVRRGLTFPTELTWSVASRSAPSEERDRFFHRLIHLLAAGGDRRGLERVLEQLHTRPGEEPPPAVYSARIRLALREMRCTPDCTEDCTEDVSRLSDLVQREAGSTRSSAYLDDYLLSIAEYHLSRRDYPRALESCKKSILLGQESGAGERRTDVRGAGQLLMARIALSQRRMRDAVQYLGFAREDAGDDPATLLTARMLEAVRLVLYGNLTRAAEELQQLVAPLLETGFTEWLLFNWFVQARILFELGNYDRARARFLMVARHARGAGKAEPARTAEAWAARSVLQLEPENLPARESLSGEEIRPESLLFLGEALCRTGDFAHALPVLQEACALESREDHVPRLGICWDNGFASLEDLVIGHNAGESELLRIATAYRGWALAVTGEMDEAVSIFFGLTRGNGGMGEDPYAGLYNYLYASILPKERSPDRDDALTVLGKAVKIVQERTNRIEHHRDRTAFLAASVWNRKIMAAARSVNLA